MGSTVKSFLKTSVVCIRTAREMFDSVKTLKIEIRICTEQIIAVNESHTHPFCSAKAGYVHGWEFDNGNPRICVDDNNGGNSLPCGPKLGIFGRQWIISRHVPVQQNVASVHFVTPQCLQFVQRCLSTPCKNGGLRQQKNHVHCTLPSPLFPAPSEGPLQETIRWHQVGSIHSLWPYFRQLTFSEPFFPHSNDLKSASIALDAAPLSIAYQQICSPSEFCISDMQALYQ